jgi:HEAT repeat protein
MADPQTLIDDLVRAPGETVTRLREAPAGAPLVEALALAPDAHTRMLLCDVLGFRKEAGAVDALVACLEDESPEVRSSAADALAKIGDARAGAPIFARAALPEPDAGARRMLVAALGAVGHQPAIPLLTELLDATDPSLRGNAAWSLGALRAAGATFALREALTRERSAFAADHMRAALANIGGARSEP